jgi:hypothetical protein
VKTRGWGSKTSERLGETEDVAAIVSERAFSADIALGFEQAEVLVDDGKRERDDGLDLPCGDSGPRKAGNGLQDALVVLKVV